MFLKVSKSKNKTYLKIVESYRDSEGKVRHRVIHNLGNIDYYLNDSVLKKLLEILYENSKRVIYLDDINKDGNSNIYEYGFIIIKDIWNRYKLNDFFINVLDKYNKRVNRDDFLKRVFSLVINRALYSQCSKLKYISSNAIYEDINSDLKLEQLYKTLDILAEIKEDLEEYLFKIRRNLFNNEIKVAFYDVTTLYYESKKEDTLRKFGLSKDFKINEVQIVLGLLIDNLGFPIGFDIYAGNKSELTTILDSLEKLKNRFNIKKITIVADRGLSKSLNLAEIKKRGFEYIVGVNFKNSKSIQEQMFNLNDYTQISFCEDKGYYGYKEFIIKQDINSVNVYEGYELFKELEDKKEKDNNKIYIDNNSNKRYFKTNISLTHKIISTYSDSRAKKDEYDRNRAIKKLQEKINNNRAIKKSKYLKAINSNSNSSNSCKVTYEIDLEKINEDKKFDGFYAIASSDLSLSALEAIKIHKQLYSIEDAFRDLKHTLKLRPIYHWNPKRVLGHITISFLSFALLKDLEYRVNNSKDIQEYLDKNQETISLDKIVSSIKSLTITKVNIKNNSYYIKQKLPTLSSKILNLLKIKSLPNIFTKEQFNKIYSL